MNDNKLYQQIYNVAGKQLQLPITPHIIKRGYPIYKTKNITTAIAMFQQYDDVNYFRKQNASLQRILINANRQGLDRTKNKLFILKLTRIFPLQQEVQILMLDFIQQIIFWCTDNNVNKFSWLQEDIKQIFYTYNVSYDSSTQYTSDMYINKTKINKILTQLHIYEKNPYRFIKRDKKWTNSMFQVLDGGYIYIHR